MVIDAHGHYTTAPQALRAFRGLQISQMARPGRAALKISDDEIRASIEQGQLRLLNERGIDLMLFSPMASAMGHHFGGPAISRYWTEANNDLVHRVCGLYPRRFAAVCSLPQSPNAPIGPCVEELERCVNDLGFVGCNLNPDPSGGYWTGPPLGHESWYPLYDALQRLDVPAMIHASSTCNPAFHTTGSHYLNTDATAFLQLMDSRVLLDFPRARFIMPHGGGNVPFQSARYRALALMNKWEPFEQFVSRFYFDTTVYSQEAMELLIRVVGVDRVVFASEMLGGVNATDPQTGRSFDDNRIFVDAIAWLSDDDRQKIFEANVRQAYPRLAAVAA